MTAAPLKVCQPSRTGTDQRARSHTRIQDIRQFDTGCVELEASEKAYWMRAKSTKDVWKRSASVQSVQTEESVLSSDVVSLKSKIVNNCPDPCCVFVKFLQPGTRDQLSRDQLLNRLTV